MKMDCAVFGAVLENSEDMIAVRDREFRLVLYNNAFARVIRDLFSQEAVVGMNTYDLLPKEA